MAAQITHIALTEKIFDKYFADKNKQEFVVGTNFPDIRRMANIERDLTHFNNETMESVVAEENSFMAGFRFHSLVDIDSTLYRRNSGLLNLFPKSIYLHEGVKAFEDRVMYGKVSDWEEIRQMFDVVLEEELQFGTSLEIVKNWHDKLKKYYFHEPNTGLEVSYIISEPMEVAVEINNVAERVKDKALAMKIIDDYYENFESRIR